MCEKVIDVQNISKKFGKSSALQDVSFSFRLVKVKYLDF
ncbi:hypothetical protein I872_00265 [Streptococcus cristatus AS 1.3089]|uniref:ABC transporter ATP-binding protein n=1 Tax=Streptococcus cristatus AS 1.3089 TaxID=1302863 RepID=A0ABM5NHJ3_STRCR|nr:hypothetical protein I872_00265 [Streptococcus cristatus AS 1.3089]